MPLKQVLYFKVERTLNCDRIVSFGDAMFRCRMTHGYLINAMANAVTSLNNKLQQLSKSNDEDGVAHWPGGHIADTK